MLKNCLIAPNTVNIFTDGSIYKNERTRETIGCAGYTIVMGGQVLSKGDYVLRDTTNNECEIYAILLGLSAAINSNLHIDNRINLFSDSKICIFGLREWIFSWLEKMKEGVLYNSNNQEVMNQHVFTMVINMILQNNLSINLYHQKGHINYNNGEHLIKATNTFIESNGISYNEIDNNFIAAISFYNDMVDVDTKKTLTMMKIKGAFNYKVVKGEIPFIIDLSEMSTRKYRQIIGGL